MERRESSCIRTAGARHYYRCKSYCTFGCDVKLKLQEIPDQPGKDDWILVGEHSDMCKRKNGIKPANYTSPGKQGDGANLRDVTKVFKKRLVESAMDKIRLAPMKIWCMVHDETVDSKNEGPLTFPTSVVVSTFFYDIAKYEKEILCIYQGTNRLVLSSSFFSRNMLINHEGMFMLM
jgi:hypothetical protein